VMSDLESAPVQVVDALESHPIVEEFTLEPEHQKALIDVDLEEPPE